MISMYVEDSNTFRRGLELQELILLMNFKERATR